MSVSVADVFQKAEGVSFTDIPDGLAVNDAEGEAIHFLNPVASAVFLLCDGALDAAAIAAILKEEFALEETPIRDVLNCLAELEAESMVQKVS
jgi:hypothetical protein